MQALNVKSECKQNSFQGVSIYEVAKKYANSK